MSWPWFLAGFFCGIVFVAAVLVLLFERIDQ